MHLPGEEEVSGEVVVEEANSGDSGGSGLEAEAGTSEGDSAECDDGDGVGEAAGLTKGVEAGGCGDEAIVDRFPEDRGEEDGIRCSHDGLTDFVESVAGDGDDGGGESGGGVALEDFSVGDGGVLEADVHAVSASCDGGIEGRVDDDDGTAGLLEDAAGDAGENGGGKVFFAEMDDFNSLLRP